MVDFRNHDEAFDKRYLTTAELYGQLVGWKVWNWGSNTSGELGDNTTAAKSSPVQTVMGGTGWKYVSAGKNFSSAIAEDYKIWSQGDNTYGQLGDGYTGTYKSSPVQTTAGGYDWAHVAAGDTVSVALKKNGTLWTWGRNFGYDLGMRFWPTTAVAFVPIQPIDGTWTQISNGNNSTAAIKSDGTLWLWGNSTSGALGLGTVTATGSPTQIISGGTNWRQASCSYGSHNSAATKLDGTLWTWGANTYGQLGDSTTVNKSSPVQTVTGGTDWVQVAVGGFSTAGVKTDGTLWTWGRNQYGQLGDNTTTNMSSPVQTVAGGTDWRVVSVGSSHTAAIKTDGTLWTWGFNSSGQLGDGTTVNKSSPIQTVAGGANWSRVAAGKTCTLAIKTDGTLWGWGATGADTASNTPAQVSSGTDWEEVSVTWYAQAVKKDGSIWGWGDNSYNQAGLGLSIGSATSPTIHQTAQGWNWKELHSGDNNQIVINGDNSIWVTGSNSRGQLGLRDTQNKSSLVQWGKNSDWALVEMGRWISAGIKTDGTLWMWGYNSSHDLATGNGLPQSSPVQTIAGGNDWKTVSTTQGHVGAIKTDGTLWMWGSNDNGQLGDSTTTTKSSPVQTVAGGTNWSQVSTFLGSTAAIKTDGTLWVWGNNSNGQLGDNTTIKKSSPVQTVAGGTNWASVSVGYRHTGAIKTDGTLWMWGHNSYGALGDNTVTHRSSPVQTVAGGTNWASIFCGSDSTLAMKTDGTIWGWGDNWVGNLGDGTKVDKSSPVQVLGGGTDWKQLAYRQAHAVALKTDGSIWVWGKDAYGELGGLSTSYPNYTTNPSSPTQLVTMGTGWKYVSCGYETSAAIKYDGSLWTWGRNTYGTLGNNMYSVNVNPTPAPVYASDPVTVISADAGSDVMSIVKTNNTLWSVGANDAGQLGDGTTVDKSSPVQTVAGGTNWKQVSNGSAHTAAVKTDGTLWVWGANTYGQLGNETTSNTSSPVQTVSATTDWLSVACGDYHTLAIKKDGTLWTWGRNDSGQLGILSNVNTSSPVQTVAYGRDWKSISGGTGHSAAMKTDGSLWVWGRAVSGELGENSTVSRSSPVQTVIGGATWKQVDCGGNHTTGIQYGEDNLYVYFNFK